MSVLQWIALIILAITPVIIWAVLLLRGTKEHKALLLKVFCWGAVATLPLLLYRYSWQIFPELNVFAWLNSMSSVGGVSLLAIPLPLLISFLLIGLTEEVVKSLVLRYKVPTKEIKSPPEAIEYSIAIALGFAFVENISYFAEVYTHYDGKVLIGIFISRTIFATFAHILFSSLFGYYYGVAVLAKKVIKERQRYQVRAVLWLKSKFPSLNKVELFAKEELFLGLMYAALTHAAYNIFLELQLTYLLVPFLLLGSIELKRLRNIRD